jgi:hypothetical protein
MRRILYPLLFIFLGAGVSAGDVDPRAGGTDTGDEIYLFYLHGRIVEDEGPTPTHPRYGLYDYPAIVEALGARGATVVSEVRASGTNASDYARKTSAQIEKLVGQGVPPGQIVVAGFSKGGGIAIQTSHLLGHPDVRYVVMASCAGWISSSPDLTLSGRVFSIYEASDELGTSCADLANRGSAVTTFQELRISTGKEHGAFYLPRAVWTTPLLNWVHGASND